MKDNIRITGTILSVHPSEDKHGSSFGIIAGDDNKTYVYSSRNIFRNFSQAIVGAKVSFEIVAYSYATSINQLDKHKPIQLQHD